MCFPKICQIKSGFLKSILSIAIPQPATSPLKPAPTRHPELQRKIQALAIKNVPSTTQTPKSTTQTQTSPSSWSVAIGSSPCFSSGAAAPTEGNIFLDENPPSSSLSPSAKYGGKHGQNAVGTCPNWGCRSAI